MEEVVVETEEPEAWKELSWGQQKFVDLHIPKIRLNIFLIGEGGFSQFWDLEPPRLE